jgi:hypothetical protein
LRERSVEREEAFWYCNIFWYCANDKSFSWVHGEGRRKREEKEDLLAKSADKNCMLSLI